MRQEDENATRTTMYDDKVEDDNGDDIKAWCSPVDHPQSSSSSRTEPHDATSSSSLSALDVVETKRE